MTSTEEAAKAKADAVAEHRKNEVTASEKLGTLKKFLDARALQLTALSGNKALTSKLVQIVLAEASRNLKLLECDPLSLYQSIQVAARLGLMPGGDQADGWIIPYYNKHLKRTEAQWQTSYRGMAKLAERSGKIDWVRANLIYKGENFTQDQVTGETHHAIDEKTLGIDRSDVNIIGGYGVVKFKGQDKPVALTPLTIQEIEKRRERAKSKDIWRTDYKPMVRKTIYRAMFADPMVPRSDALDLAIDLEDETIDVSEVVKTIPHDEVVPEPLFTPEQLAEMVDDSAKEAAAEMRESWTAKELIEFGLENNIGQPQLAAWSDKEFGIADLKKLTPSQVGILRQKAMVLIAERQKGTRSGAQ